VLASVLLSPRYLDHGRERAQTRSNLVGRTGYRWMMVIQAKLAEGIAFHWDVGRQLRVRAVSTGFYQSRRSKAHHTHAASFPSFRMLLLMYHLLDSMWGTSEVGHGQSMARGRPAVIRTRNIVSGKGSREYFFAVSRAAVKVQYCTTFCRPRARQAGCNTAFARQRSSAVSLFLKYCRCLRMISLVMK